MSQTLGKLYLAPLIWGFFMFASDARAVGERVDWRQPPALCPEEVIPFLKKAAAASEEHLKNSKLEKFGQDYEDTLVVIKGAEQIEDKINDIYDAANQYDMPPAVLLGSLLQESTLADDGLDLDGGNFACGIAQLNVTEWCHWAAQLDDTQAEKVQWPKKAIDEYNRHARENFCVSDYEERTFVIPFVQRAQKLNPSMPAHRLPMSTYAKIKFRDVKKNLSTVSPTIRKLQYLTAQSFFAHCADHKISITILASILAELYAKFVPEDLKRHEFYKDGEGFKKTCAKPVRSRAYPFNTGWLLTDVMFNAGENVPDDVSHLKTMPWQAMTPYDLVSFLKPLGIDGHISAVVNRASAYPILK